MSRPKRGSKVLDKAQRRIAALKSINPTLDLGNGVTIDSFATVIKTTQDKLEAYNSSLSSVDMTQEALEVAEKSLMELTKHMLLSVAAKYGKNSDEYKMAGGVRRSDVYDGLRLRKRPVRKPKQDAVA
ncbi:hypothetical protein [Nostoc sp. ChiVER01]|uniref:hypothetical protein n=1 Tax=Nostoc sp. ChiVER01 TaxID=3075382 RepID=UPI002AD44F06|nr:hypothetical protein [Nostoc sp. ChiVER01]MDZ8228080.1 hypothetical protein [Nostoc sp. ChiVER01]